MKQEKVVLITDDEAAKQVTVTGWVSRHGRFYGDAERSARWDGCTHIVCACGAPQEKGYTHCQACRDKRDRERWEAMPVVDWDGETPLVCYRSDEWFFNTDQLVEHCEDNEIEIGDLMLVNGAPIYARQIDEDYWSDDLAEDCELPKPIRDALNQFNAAVAAYKEPLSWHMGKYRVRVAIPEKGKEPSNG
jgi:hypothetical protein